MSAIECRFYLPNQGPGRLSFKILIKISNLSFDSANFNFHIHYLSMCLLVVLAVLRWGGYAKIILLQTKRSWTADVLVILKKLGYGNSFPFVKFSSI